MHEPFVIAVISLHCIVDTDEFDSDEPYVLVFVADITRQNLVPAARTTMYGPWGDADPGETMVTTPIPDGAPAQFIVDALPWRRACWGIGGGPATIGDAEDLLVLVALMEHDNGSPGGVRTGMHAQVFAALAGYFPEYVADRMTRQELVDNLRRDIDGALSGPIAFGFIEGEDLAGPATEVPVTNDDLEALHNGAVERDIDLKGDGGHYRVRFELSVPEALGEDGSPLEKAPAALPPGEPVAAAARAEGRIDVLGRGADRRFYLSSWNGAAWSAWAPIGRGVFVSGPALAVRSGDRLDAFGRGDDRRVYISSWGGQSWSAWSAIGVGTFLSAPAAVSPNGESLEVFAVGDDRRVYHARWLGQGWSGWGPVGIGTFTAGPAVAARGRRLDVFGRGDDRRIYQANWSGRAWSAWSPLGDGTFTSGPAVVASGGDRLDVFGRGDDRRVYHSSWSPPGWSNWSPIGAGTFTGGPGAVSWAPGRLDVFAAGDDRRLYHAVWAGQGWTGWLADTPPGVFV